MLTFTKVTSKTSEKKFNTLFSLKGNQKEFGKNCIRWLIPQMFYCTFLMQGILMERELSLLSTTLNISARTSIWCSFWINAIWFLLRWHKNGWNICQRRHQHWRSKLLFLTLLEKDLWSSCSSNSISSIKTRKTSLLVWLGTQTSVNHQWSTLWWRNIAAELPRSQERLKYGNTSLWPREFI
jgi:hypothetical protein